MRDAKEIGIFLPLPLNISTIDDDWTTRCAGSRLLEAAKRVGAQLLDIDNRDIDRSAVQQEPRFAHGVLHNHLESCRIEHGRDCRGERGLRWNDEECKIGRAT